MTCARNLFEESCVYSYDGKSYALDCHGEPRIAFAMGGFGRENEYSVQRSSRDLVGVFVCQ